MSILKIQAALEKHLLSITPALATAVENKTFTPTANVPYQRISHLINDPVDVTLKRDTVQKRGILQVSLYYPLNAGRVPAMTRAELIAAHFAPVQLLAEDGVSVEIVDSPRIAGGMASDDRWFVPVSIRWQAFISQ